MIYAFSFTCNRDLELSEMMGNSLAAQCNTLADLLVINTDLVESLNEYGNGAGWQSAMMKLDALRGILKLNDVHDEDYILSVDSDVVFTSPKVFEHVTGADIIGTQHNNFYPTRFGAWGHMSGAMIFIRGSVAKKITLLMERELTSIRLNHFKPFDITENEDVVLSYLVRYVNGSAKNLPGNLSGGDFESDILNGKLKSFYHLNYMPTQFLGEPTEGKWSIPGIIKRRDIKL